MTGRRLGAAGFGAFVAFWSARALFKWILDVDGTAYIALAAVFVIIGVAVAVAAELEEERKSSRRRARERPPTTGPDSAPSP